MLEFLNYWKYQSDCIANDVNDALGVPNGDSLYPGSYQLMSDEEAKQNDIIQTIKPVVVAKYGLWLWPSELCKRFYTDIDTYDDAQVWFMIRYVLATSSYQRLVTYKHIPKSEFIKKFREFVHTSPACQVKFTGEIDPRVVVSYEARKRLEARRAKHKSLWS